MINKKVAMRIIGENIKSFRLQCRLNQDELALLALDYQNTMQGRKAAQTKISNFERGRQMPNIIELYMIARTLKTTIEKIIGAAIPAKNIH